MPDGRDKINLQLMRELCMAISKATGVGVQNYYTFKIGVGIKWHLIHVYWEQPQNIILTTFGSGQTSVF